MQTTGSIAVVAGQTIDVNPNAYTPNPVKGAAVLNGSGYWLSITVAGYTYTVPPGVNDFLPLPTNIDTQIVVAVGTDNHNPGISSPEIRFNFYEVSDQLPGAYPSPNPAYQASSSIQSSVLATATTANISNGNPANIPLTIPSWVQSIGIFGSLFSAGPGGLVNCGVTFDLSVATGIGDTDSIYMNTANTAGTFPMSNPVYLDVVGPGQNTLKVSTSSAQAFQFNYTIIGYGVPASQIRPSINYTSHQVSLSGVSGVTQLLAVAPAGSYYVVTSFSCLITTTSAAEMALLDNGNGWYDTIASGAVNSHGVPWTGQHKSKGPIQFFAGNPASCQVEYEIHNGALSN